MQTHRKHADTRAIDFEVAGLEELSRAADSGGAAVAYLVDRGPDWLETEFIVEGQPTAQNAHDFGRYLAITHCYSSGPTVFGQAPAGLTEPVGFMGRARLSLTPAGSISRTFGEFYAEDRLLPYVSDALANDSINTEGARTIDQLCERLRDGLFDSPQPQLVQQEAALLHGDLWNGNIMWRRDTDGNTGAIATLIDPACHYGHAESDLAQLTVFGAPHTEQIFEGYQAVSPLADGWRERRGLHRLHMLIVHAALFGGGYGLRTIDTAKRYL